MHNCVPLSPTTFLERTGRALPTKQAVCHSGGVVCFGELMKRARRVAQVLTNLGVVYGDRVGVVSENTLQAIETQFAIPAVGAVIVTLNPWLPSKDIADQLDFCEAKVVIISEKFLVLHRDTLARRERLRHVISLGSDIGYTDLSVVRYEEAIAKASDQLALDTKIRSELDPIAINFTSGTTGCPKGVVLTHRAAYLHAIGQVLMLGLTRSSVYLWSLPMFHVNGWGHMWANVAIGATQIVMSGKGGEKPELIEEIKQYSASHLAGAPRLVRSLVDATDAHSALCDLTILTGGAAPSPVLITQLETMGVRLIHQYGLNETFGPYVVCERQEEWKQLSTEERAKKMMRQGVATIHAGTGVRVVDTDMRDVPADGETLGEVVMSGNTVATGYYNNTEATEKAFAEGWFHSGDMAVMHSDGYIEIKDRIKDLIYVETEYGWENISSIEIENTIGKLPGIEDVAVIGILGGDRNTPAPKIMAFVERSNRSEVSEHDVRRYCAKELAVYKRPHYVVFGTIEKTATGKVRKDLLVKEGVAQLELLSRRDGADTAA